MLLVTAACAVGELRAQRVAVLSPDGTATSREFADAFDAEISKSLRVLDRDLSHAGYRSVSVESPFNLTADESKRIGAAIGCDAFLLIRSVNQARSAFGQLDYYESYAAIFVVSSRTGRLIWWTLATREAAKSEPSAKLLADAIAPLALEAAGRIRSALKSEFKDPDPPAIEEVPEPGSPLAKNFRAPVPYRRISPAYTPLAAFYEITATVEALVDLDPAGQITRIEITRWAGFGLDESVDAAVRQMNWRPAERSGKTLPMRFLLRYNFKKIDKEPPH